MIKNGLPLGRVMDIGKKVADNVDSVACKMQPNGKFGCKLFLDPMFIRGGPKDEVPITMVTPEGTARVMPTEVWMGNVNRRVKEIKDLVNINAHRVPTVSVEKKGRMEFHATNYKVMNCGISHLGPGTSLPGKHLNCVCMDMVKIEKDVKK